MRRYIGLDCGSTNTKVVSIDPKGTIKYTLIRHTNSMQKHLLLEEMSEIVGDIRQAEPEFEYCVGFGFPGLVDSKNHEVRWLPNYAGKFTLSQQELQDTTGCRHIEMDNDMNMAVFGEYCLRELGPEDVLLFCSVGTGFGYGVMLNGEIIKGSRGYGNQIGHSAISLEGDRCACGRNGCLELSIVPWRNTGSESAYFHLGTYIGLLINCYNPNVVVLDVDKLDNPDVRYPMFAGIRHSSIDLILNCVQFDKPRNQRFTGAIGAALRSMSLIEPHAVGEAADAINHHKWLPS